MKLEYPVDAIARNFGCTSFQCSMPWFLAQGRNSSSMMQKGGVLVVLVGGWRSRLLTWLLNCLYWLLFSLLERTKTCTNCAIATHPSRQQLFPNLYHKIIESLLTCSLSLPMKYSQRHVWGLQHDIVRCFAFSLCISNLPVRRCPHG